MGNGLVGSGPTVITAIFGGYDEVPPIPSGFSQAVLVSDRKIKSDWDNRVVSTNFNPRLAAKIPKFRPDLFMDSSESVWMDASLRDPSDWLFRAACAALQDSDFTLFRHPQRSSIEDEALESIKMRKYQGMPLMSQVQSYLNQGFRDDFGLWACGVLVRRHTPTTLSFGDKWFLENSLWTVQDQISFPYLAWHQKLEFNSFSEDQYKGPLRWHRHSKEEGANLRHALVDVLSRIKNSL